MKMRKVISTVLAGVLALSALPISAMSAGAEGAYAPGDVDMDGVITGHDAAVVSRYLHVDNTLLNADQLALADVNGDGVVDQADADWIHENEEVELGACDISVPNPTSLFYQLVYIANTGAGNHFTIVDEDISTEQIFDLKISQKNFNLLDVTGDGKIDLDNSMLIHLVKIIAILFHFLNDQLCTITYHKILLINSKLLSCFIRIIRIQE